MRAQLLHQPAPIADAPLHLAEVPSPIAGPGEVGLRVLACGVCHTDLHIVEGDLPPRLRPVVPGHQIVGEVETVGPGVARFRRGDRAGVAWLGWADGTCAYCLRGQENLCPVARFTGWDRHGGYAEYAVAAAGFVYLLPPELDPAHAAPLLCAGVVGYRALRLSGAKAGDRLGLVGFGGSAHITLQVARHLGCEVAVLTRGETHRRVARTLGAAWAGGMEDAAPESLDAAIIFAPAGALVPATLRLLRPGATLALAGITMTDIPAMPYDLLYRERVLRSVANATRRDAEDLLTLAGQIPIRTEITRYPLDAANTALADLKHSRVPAAAVLVM
jgi:alcohol dehydrogenase, propanol-preferring